VNNEIQDLITKGQAMLVYHLECSQTGFRTAISTDKNVFSKTISNKEVRGRLQICPFIVASENIVDFYSDSFNDDYSGFKFLIESGCVMAISKQYNLDVEFEINELTNTPSVFAIIKNDEENALGIDVEMNSRRIIIKLPIEEFENYKRIQREPTVQPILNSLVVIPTLTFVLEEVSKRDPADRYEYNDYAWYRAVKKALANQFDCKIESDEYNELNYIETSQKLINTPIGDALRTLSFGFGQDIEEDDE
jgi:hypothetical protein